MSLENFVKLMAPKATIIDDNLKRKSNDFNPKKQKWSNIPFPYLFFTFVQNFKPNKGEMCIWMFSLSHFERITWILLMMGGITIFLESRSIFSCQINMNHLT